MKKNIYIIKKIIDYLYLKIRGVETQFGYCSLKGFPIISKKKGSKIIIKKGVTIISKSRYNLAGIHSKSILATKSKGAIIEIGENSGISGGKIVAVKEIKIGKNVGLGVNTAIYDTDFHPVNYLKRRKQKNILDADFSSIIIKDDVWIGANSLILKGTIINEKVVVGAGSVITGKSLDENSIYAGNPCKKIKEIGSEETCL